MQKVHELLFEQINSLEAVLENETFVHAPANEELWVRIAEEAAGVGAGEGQPRHVQSVTKFQC